jgi:gamma-glutamyl-gamma-aminobutyrate hydrolase PuuD
MLQKCTYHQYLFPQFDNIIDTLSHLQEISRIMQAYTSFFGCSKSSTTLNPMRIYVSEIKAGFILRSLDALVLDGGRNIPKRLYGITYAGRKQIEEKFTFTLVHAFVESSPHIKNL